MSNNCEWEGCKEKLQWKVGFTVCSEGNRYEGSGDNEFQRGFCDEHLISLSGCGNAVEFRHIGIKEWKDFGDHDNPFILEGIVKKSYKLYISKEVKSKLKSLSKFYNYNNNKSS